MSRGVSLLETMVVLVLTTTLFGGAVIGLASVRRGLIVRAESDRLRLLLERAYTLALTSQDSSRVEFVKDRIALWSGDNRVTSYQAARGVSLEAPPHLTDGIRFYSSHTASPATISIRLGSTVCSLTISLRGRIRATC